MRLTGSIFSSLYNNENPSQTPDWIAETDFQFTEKQALDIDFDNRTIAQEKIQVNRDTRDYSAKKLTAKLNNNEVMLSKVELSKFLSNKHYQIKEANKTDKQVILKTLLNNIPGSFEFIYDINNNHIVQGKLFNYNNTQYPFNKAGLEECINDIKKNKITAKKVENTTGAIITAEEIYRRYNGHIRKATDRINQLLKEEAIIGVGSNKFGTFYDIDYLFPQEDKESIKQEPAFEFVQNLEKVAATPHKSAYQLTMEASKMLESSFDDFKIIDYKRDNNKLTVQAKVLKNNNSKLQIFDFDIKDENIVTKDVTANINGSNYTNKYNKYISESNIINKQAVKDILVSNGYINADIDNIFNTLKANKVVTQIDNNNYISSNTIEEILNDHKELFGKRNIDDYYKFSDKTGDHKFNKENVIDTDTRQDYNNKNVHYYTLEACKQLQHNFDDFEVMEYNLNNNKLFIKAKVLKNGITKIGNFGFLIKNNKLQTKTFKDITTDTINHNSKFNDKNIISKKHINAYLKDNGYFNYDLDNVLNTLRAKDIISQIDNNNYVSKYNFAQLLKYAKNLIGLQNKEKLSKLINKNKQFRKLNEIDTGKREVQAYVTDETTINAINNYLLKYFDDFNVLDFHIYQNDKNKSIIYDIEVFDADTGLTLNLSLNIICENNIVKNCITEINGEQFSLEDIKNAFTISDSLNNYLKTNTKQIKSDIIFSKKEFANKLLKVAHLSNIDDTIQLLKNKEYITEIGLNKYASKYTIAELINRSNLKALNDNEINAILKKQQVNKNTLQANYINDNDTRNMVDNWTVDETRIYIMNQISKLFKHFEILDININQDNYIITINGTDDDGLNKNMIVYFDIDKNHPSIITNITRPNSNETIQEYLNYNQPNTYNSNGIITQKQLEQQLLEVIDIKEFNNILDMLLNDGVIVPLSSNQYKLNNTMSEIVGYIDKKKKTNITANKNRLRSAVKAYDVTDTVVTNDSDTRDMIDNWTADEIKIYITNQISKLFKRFEILDINVNEDNYIITINGTDDDGLNKNMIVYFDIDKNHPNVITNIIKPDSNETIQEYLNYNQANTYNSNGIITQKQLEQQLLEVIDIKEFNNILDMLLSDGVIVPLSANQYKLNNTMSEIVGYIDKKKKTNITANKNRLCNVVKAYDVTDTVVTNDSDTRSITQQQELSLAGKVARKRIINNLTNAYNNKMITQNKYNTLLAKTKTANSERTLSEVENELKKYL